MKSIFSFVADHPGCKSGTIAEKLDMANPTVKKLLKDLVDLNLIEKYGVGRGTNYAIK